MFENFGERVPKNMQSNGDIENIQNADNVKGKRKKKGIKGRSKEETEGTESTIDLQEDTSNILDELGKKPEADRKNLNEYLKYIRRFSLLSPEEEISLAICIKENNQRASELIERANKLDAEAKKLPEGDIKRVKIEKDIKQAKEASEQAMKNSEQAKAKFTKANLRLVVSIAMRYRDWGISQGIPFFDLIQEGNLWLMKAVEKFDYTRGKRFSTYATATIRGRISIMINEWSRSISIPADIRSLLSQIKRVKGRYFLEFGKMPTPEHLAKELGKTVEQIIGAERAASIGVSSLDVPVSIRDVNGSTREDFIKDEISPESGVSTDLFKKELRRAMKYLTDREKRILSLRHGLEEDGCFYTLAEIGAKFGLTRQRVQQIVKEARGKLLQTNPQLKKTLEGFLRSR